MSHDELVGCFTAIFDIFAFVKKVDDYKGDVEKAETVGIVYK